MAGYHELEHKQVLIIGGSGGIGRSCVRLFADAGANVGFTYKRSKTLANRLTSELKADGAKVRNLRLDVTSQDEVNGLATSVRRYPGHLDAVVMCQGIITGKSLKDCSMNEISSTFEVNILSIIKLTKLLRPFMSRGSAIIYIASISAFAGSYDPVYASSKGAIVSFTKAVAKELAPAIRVNTVAPGLTEDTGMYEEMSVAVRRKHSESTILKRLAKPNDIANAVVFLASSSSSHITGACLDVNGGEYLR